MPPWCDCIYRSPVRLGHDRQGDRPGGEKTPPINLIMSSQYKGRRQNSLAAPPIFSSQLQPTFIGKAIHSFWMLQHFGCSQVLWILTSHLRKDILHCTLRPSVGLHATIAASRGRYISTHRYHMPPWCDCTYRSPVHVGHDRQGDRPGGEKTLPINLIISSQYIERHTSLYFTPTGGLHATIATSRGRYTSHIVITCHPGVTAHTDLPFTWGMTDRGTDLVVKKHFPSI